MIMATFGRYLPVSGRDHEKDGAKGAFLKFLPLGWDRLVGPFCRLALPGQSAPAVAAAGSSTASAKLTNKVARGVQSSTNTWKYEPFGAGAGHRGRQRQTPNCVSFAVPAEMSGVSGTMGRTRKLR
jgi:hypothetical protein